MDDITIEPVRDGDLAEILRTFERFWGDRSVSPPDGIHGHDHGAGLRGRGDPYRHAPVRFYITET